MATCPECDAELDVDGDDLDEMEVDDPWDCDSCGSRLRVASLDPLEFDADEDEDEDDDDREDKKDEEGDDLDEDDEDEEDDDREWDE